MTVKERLVTFIESLELSPSQFEKNCGISNGYVNNIRKSIGTEILKKIEKTYPQLNKIWLLHGQGEMLTQNTTADYKEKYFALLEEVAQERAKKIKELESKKGPAQSANHPVRKMSNEAPK